MNEAVLDASAVLALLQNEPGASEVVQTLPGALICSVNLSEVVAKLSEVGMPEKDIRMALELGFEVVPFDERLAYRAGALSPKTRAVGLSLGDRACLALAGEKGLPAMTTDRSWTTVSTGARVRCIRPE